jgi:hypothetical protein
VQQIRRNRQKLASLYFKSFGKAHEHRRLCGFIGYTYRLYPLAGHVLSAHACTQFNLAQYGDRVSVRGGGHLPPLEAGCPLPLESSHQSHTCTQYIRKSAILTHNIFSFAREEIHPYPKGGDPVDITESWASEATRNSLRG